MKRLVLPLSLCFCSLACDEPPEHASGTEPADGRDDAFPGAGKADGGLVEGSPAALGVLALVNSAPFEVLDDDVGLDVRAAEGIWDVRMGPDGVEGTADDESFETLAQLDAVPWVGPVALARLLTYAQEHGHVAPAMCVPGTLIVAGDPIVEDSRWTACTIDVFASTHVVKGATLTIAPGAEIRFRAEPISSHGVQTLGPTLAVSGELIARGTAGAPIRFTRMTPGHDYHVSISGRATLYETRWNSTGIRVATQEGHVDVSHSWFRGDESVLRRGPGLLVSGEAVIRASLFERVSGAAAATQEGVLDISDTVIRDTAWGIGLGSGAANACDAGVGVAALQMEHVDIIGTKGRALTIARTSSASVEASNFQPAAGNAVDIGSGDGTAVSIVGNNFADAGAVHVITRAVGKVDLSGNYWGRLGSVGGWSAVYEHACGTPNTTGFSQQRIDDAGPRRELVPDFVWNASLAGAGG